MLAGALIAFCMILNRCYCPVHLHVAITEAICIELTTTYIYIYILFRFWPPELFDVCDFLTEGKLT